jgi:2-polyprenyl-6-methoxyphenol hydroxylase-like FAD-dependent oxidoreductase
MTEHQVVIAGGGPTGLMLAGELALAGVDVVIVERRASQDLVGLRAGGLHMRTLEVLDQRGIVERFVSQGQPHRVAPFARTLLDVSDTPTRHTYFLALWQTHIERTLAEWVAELRVPVLRGRELADFTQHEAGVEVALSEGTLRAQYLVGCDGGRSVIRKRAGIDFPGWDASMSYLIAEVELAEEPAWGMRHGEKAFAGIGKLEDGKGARVVVAEQHVVRGDPTLGELREALIAVYGTDYGLRSAQYVSRFSDMTRQAASYRAGRVLLAGDAAHVHSPMGGQGLNLGVQDAVNLGWKLARVVHGTSPESLLDSYHSERHAVAARVLRNTMALSALERGDARSDALRELMTELVRVPQARRRYVAMSSGLDIHYDLGEGHPLLGRRMPDLDLETAEGPRRLFTLLHEARPLLLDLGEHLNSARVRRVDARYAGTWELPGIGVVPAPRALLVRPDGYVAWVAGGALSLQDALTTWFGQSA